MKILLANLPWQRDGNWGVRAGSRWPHIKDKSEGGYLPFPFFLAYSASLLLKNGFDVEIIDAIAEEETEEQFLKRLEEIKPDYIVAETSIPSFYEDLELLKKIRQSGVKIVLCGPNYEIYEAKFLQGHSFIDFVLYGEYELSLLNLMQSVSEKSGLSRVKGLIYREKGLAIKNDPMPPFDIDLLPWPQRDGLPMEKYLDAPGEMKVPCAQIVASRGCPFKCKFCLWPQVIYQGCHYRARNSEDVINEFEYLVKAKGFKSVYFDDDTFNVGKKRMLELCSLIKLRGLDKTQWAIMARPDLMDEEILENMKEAGLWAVKYGMESAEQALVDNIGKDMDLKKADRMIRFTQSLGVRVHLTFTFGLPGETKKTIMKTIEYAKSVSPFSVQFSITTPFPGTEYHGILSKENRIISDNFARYDGHSGCVINLEGLSASDLENAKDYAYKTWDRHVAGKKSPQELLKRFYDYAVTKGVFYSVRKVFSYLKRACS